jgi:uncharacterized protein YndB with AHSA1/START domain
MTRRNDDRYDPSLDLVLERVVDVPRRLVWMAWTQPAHVKKWFAPPPWTTVDCEIDLRPGGVFRTVMRSPEGRDFPNVGCYLELVENERIVWTDALAPGYRPSLEPFFTAILTFEDHAGGTKYIARALHKDLADRKTHEGMGFLDGWGRCLDQLVAAMKSL